MKAKDAIVHCFQLTANFPSWTSRVRSPPPALSFSNLGPIGVFNVTAITAFSPRGTHLGHGNTGSNMHSRRCAPGRGRQERETDHEDR
jgi:hypothetical protein